MTRRRPIILRTVERVIAWWHSRRLTKAIPHRAGIIKDIERARRRHRPTRTLNTKLRELTRARLEAERTMKESRS